MRYTRRMFRLPPLSSPGLTRRDLLRLLVALSAFLPLPVLLAASGTKKSLILPVLGAWLDTLIPADQSPSATQLGLDSIILDSLRGNSRQAQILVLGCNWAEREAIKSGVTGFVSLDETGCIAIVSKAEMSPRPSLPNVFFRTTIDLAFREYYALEAVWASLGYAGPPQPAGFPGHDRAPGKDS